MEKEGGFFPKSCKETMTIKVVCSRCGKEMGEKMGEVSSGVEPVSHALCEKCLEETRREFGLIK